MRRAHFRRELLPPARLFYEQQFGQLRRPDRRGWAQCRCPFHESKTKSRSLQLNLATGGFFCFSCGAKGGDLIAFVMQRDQVGFKTACRMLNCWDEDGQPVHVRPGPLVAYLAWDLRIDGVAHRLEILDEPRTELQRLRRLHAKAADRLAEIRNGDAESEAGEAEAQWGILAASWELIQMELDDEQRR